MNNKTQLGVIVFLTVAVLIACSFAYTAVNTSEQQKSEIANLTGQVHALSEKMLADQESNLIDLEENKKVEKRVTDVEIELQNQSRDIDEIMLKLSKGKKK